MQQTQGTWEEEHRHHSNQWHSANIPQTNDHDYLPAARIRTRHRFPSARQCEDGEIRSAGIYDKVRYNTFTITCLINMKVSFSSNQTSQVNEIKNAAGSLLHHLVLSLRERYAINLNIMT